MTPDEKRPQPREDTEHGEDHAEFPEATLQEEMNATEAEAELDAETGDLSVEVEAARERHLRLAAEFDNYRKRAERERSEVRTRARAELVESMLDALDDLQRVADSDEESTPAEALREGVRIAERKLFRALEAGGLEVIGAAGQRFDPEVHEALMTVPAETEAEDEIVADVFQRGYRLETVLIRPARVRVRKFEGGNGS